jgi:hypothetical protein
LCFFSLDLGLGQLEGNLYLVPDFDPPLPEDVMQRAWNQAHAEGVRRLKEEGKKKIAEKARRKEECDKRRRLQWQAREEESSSTNDDDEDEKEVDQYDWLDSMAKEGELPMKPSPVTEGRSPRAEPPHRELGDLDLGGAAMMGGGLEPSRPQESAHPGRTEGPQSQQMAGSLWLLPQSDTAEAVAVGKRPCPVTAGSGLSEPSQKHPRPTSLR